MLAKLNKLLNTKKQICVKIIITRNLNIWLARQIGILLKRCMTMMMQKSIAVYFIKILSMHKPCPPLIFGLVLFTIPGRKPLFNMLFNSFRPISSGMFSIFLNFCFFKSLQCDYTSLATGSFLTYYHWHKKFYCSN